MQTGTIRNHFSTVGDRLLSYMEHEKPLNAETLWASLDRKARPGCRLRCSLVSDIKVRLFSLTHLQTNF